MFRNGDQIAIDHAGTAEDDMPTTFVPAKQERSTRLRGARAMNINLGMESLTVAFVLFPNVTQFDLTRPVQVLSRLQNASVVFVAGSLDLT